MVIVSYTYSRAAILVQFYLIVNMSLILLQSIKAGDCILHLIGGFFLVHLGLYLQHFIYFVT